MCYPKRTDKPLYHGLVTQLQALGINFLEAEDVLQGGPLRGQFGLVLDAMFGFSFKGDPRPPFDALLQARSCCMPVASSIDLHSAFVEGVQSFRGWGASH